MQHACSAAHARCTGLRKAFFSSYVVYPNGLIRFPGFDHCVTQVDQFQFVVHDTLLLSSFDACQPRGGAANLARPIAVVNAVVLRA